MQEWRREDEEEEEEEEKEGEEEKEEVSVCSVTPEKELGGECETADAVIKHTIWVM